MRVLGIITARGGSKGILHKNLVPLLGKPLLAYTAEAALASKKLTRTVLSTDDEKIAAGWARSWDRRAVHASGRTGRGRYAHASRAAGRGAEAGSAAANVYDAILTLQPTNPLRRAEDIDGAIDLLEATGADSVISFVDVGERHPARMKWIDANGRVSDPPFAEAFEGQPRQQLKKLYLREGSIYLTRRSVLMEQNSLKGHDCRAWIIPEERARNIDTPFDLRIVEQILQAQGEN